MNMDVVIHAQVHVPAVVLGRALAVVEEAAAAHARILVKTPVKAVVKDHVAVAVAV